MQRRYCGLPSVPLFALRNVPAEPPSCEQLLKPERWLHRRSHFRQTRPCGQGQERVCELQRQVERTPRRILEVEDEGLCAELHAAYRKLQADLAEENKVLASFDKRLSRGPDKLNVETELQKALGLIQHIETIIADPVAREEIPSLLSALGIRIGLTFREGHSNKRRVRS